MGGDNKKFNIDWDIEELFNILKLLYDEYGLIILKLKKLLEIL